MSNDNTTKPAASVLATEPGKVGHYAIVETTEGGWVRYVNSMAPKQWFGSHRPFYTDIIQRLGKRTEGVAYHLSDLLVMGWEYKHPLGFSQSNTGCMLHLFQLKHDAAGAPDVADLATKLGEPDGKAG